MEKIKKTGLIKGLGSYDSELYFEALSYLEKHNKDDNFEEYIYYEALVKELEAKANYKEGDEKYFIVETCAEEYIEKGTEDDFISLPGFTIKDSYYSKEYAEYYLDD